MNNILFDLTFLALTITIIVYLNMRVVTEKELLKKLDRLIELFEKNEKNL
ncbi:hypothetical protein [Dehalobacter sp. 4CP]